MKILKDNGDYILQHEDIKVKLMAQGENVYMHDLNENRMAGIISGSKITGNNYS